MSEVVMKHRRRSAGNRVMDVVVYTLIILFCLMCLIPFLVAVSASFSTERTLLRDGYSFLPRDFSTLAYEMLFSTSQIYDSYKVSIFVTVAGTVLSMVVTAQKTLEENT